MNNNYNITYPSGTDYYDINVFNNNFSKLADAVDSVRSSGYQGDIIVAAYNSTNPLKKLRSLYLYTRRLFQTYLIQH